MSEARPFKVLGLQQIAVGGLDKQTLRRFWVDIMGLRYGHTYRSEKENVDEDICETGLGAFTVEVDLMQPIDPDKRPKVHDPALNHVGLWIDDLPAAVDWLERAGRSLHARRHPQAARRATTSASSIPRATTKHRSAARACWSSSCRHRPK